MPVSRMSQNKLTREQAAKIKTTPYQYCLMQTLLIADCDAFEDYIEEGNITHFS